MRETVHREGPAPAGAWLCATVDRLTPRVVDDLLSDRIAAAIIPEGRIDVSALAVAGVAWLEGWAASMVTPDGSGVRAAAGRRPSVRLDLSAGPDGVRVHLYRRRAGANDVTALLGEGSYSRWRVTVGVAFAAPTVPPGAVLVSDARVFREVRAQPRGRIAASAVARPTNFPVNTTNPRRTQR